MEKLKVCHIVNWYPNKNNNKEAIWTKKHIDALNKKCENTVYHVQVKEGKFKFEETEISHYEKSYILNINTRIWFIKEILTTLLLIYVLVFKMKRSQYDIFNFQITYPLLTYSKLVQIFIRKPIVITEHWSAYHLNFGVTKELKRIKRIFKNKKLKFICVAEALADDIQQFSGQKINYRIVPNIINDTFTYVSDVSKTNTFFMLSYWKYPKDPFLILSVFKKLSDQGKVFSAEIGGFGPLLNEMKQRVEELGLSDKVLFIGKMNSPEIVQKLNESCFFIHNSKYEVASVVCMESICCGTPVVASEVGGIKEYINEENGSLVNANDEESWEKSITQIIDKKFNGSEISANARKKFSEDVVADLYYKTLVNFNNE